MTTILNVSEKLRGMATFSSAGKIFVAAASKALGQKPQVCLVQRWKGNFFHLSGKETRERKCYTREKKFI